MSNPLDGLYRQHLKNDISRREFMCQAILITGSLETAAKAAEAYGLNLLQDGMVPANDASLESSIVSYSSGSVKMSAYVSWPKAGTTFPAVIVIHENRGLNNHIKDVARRAAKAGYMAIAPDMLFRHGGTEGIGPEAQVTEAIRKLTPDPPPTRTGVPRNP